MASTTPVTATGTRVERLTTHSTPRYVDKGIQLYSSEQVYCQLHGNDALCRDVGPGNLRHRLVTLAHVHRNCVLMNDKLYTYGGYSSSGLRLPNEPTHLRGYMWERKVGGGGRHWTRIGSSIRDWPTRHYHFCLAADALTNTLYLLSSCPQDGPGKCKSKRIPIEGNALWSFHVQTEKWEQLASVPGPFRGSTNIVIVESKLYRFGGDQNDEGVGTVNMYDILTNEWSEFQHDPRNVPDPRGNAILLPVYIAEKLHLVSIKGTGHTLEDAWAWGLESHQWRRIEAEGEWPAPRAFYAIMVRSDENGQRSILEVSEMKQTHEDEHADRAWEIRF